MKNSILNRIFLLGILLFSTGVLQAGITTQSVFLHPLAASGNITNHSDVAAFDNHSTEGSTYFNKRITQRFILKPAPDKICDNLNATYTVNIKIETWKANNATQIASTIYKTLQITVNSSGVYYNQSLLEENDLATSSYEPIPQKYKVTILSTSPSTLPDFLMIESQLEVERYYEATTSNNIIQVPAAPTIDTESKHLVVTWTKRDWAEKYDLEWMYVSSYGEGATLLTNPAVSMRDFQFNSTRVTVEGDKYEIPLIYDQGFIVYRIRGYSRNAIDFYSNEFPQPWNIINADDVSDFEDYNCKATIPVHRLGMNWQVNTTYAEEGKSKLSVDYFDGTLRKRQSVVLLNTPLQNGTNEEMKPTTVVNEVVYDYLGRPAITTLPVPTGHKAVDMVLPENNNSKAFNAPAGNTSRSYRAEDFDLDAAACSTSTQAMDNGSGASAYYSANNPFLSDQYSPFLRKQSSYIPDAALFPFTQTEYTPDNTGRIKTQTGVGADYKLGTDHVTKYFYGKPFQEELDRLFGAEAGKAELYQKNAVRDANGQFSVSYIDPYGKVIATTLAGNAPLNLTTLSTAKTPGIDNNFTVDVLNKSANQLTGTENKIDYVIGTKTVSRKLIVPDEQLRGFQYQLLNERYQPGCVSPYSERKSIATSGKPIAVGSSLIDAGTLPDLMVVYDGLVLDTIEIFKNITPSTGNGKTAFEKLGVIVLPGNANTLDYDFKDINNDGRTDIILLRDDNTILIYSAMGVSSALYYTLTTINLSFVPNKICVADINGGYADIMVSHANANTVSVFLNNNSSSLSFASPQNVETGLKPEGMVVTDVDNDGKKDLVVANSLGHSISILRVTNLSALTFAKKTDVSVGFFPVYLAAGDLDGDGKTDVVVSKPSYHNLTVMRNTTAAALSFAIDDVLVPGQGPAKPEVALVDNDTKADIVVPCSLSATVAMYKNTSVSGDIQFANIASTPAPLNPVSMVVDDFNGNGVKDLAVACDQEFSVEVWENAVQGAAGQNPSVLNASAFLARENYTTLTHPNFAVTADVNGDGCKEVIVLQKDLDKFVIYPNNCSGIQINSETFGTTIEKSTGNEPVFAWVEDMDKDKRPDLLVAFSGETYISIYRNISSGENILFDAPVNINTPSVASGLHAISIASLYANNDHKPDMIYSCSNGTDTYLVLLINKASGNNNEFLTFDTYYMDLQGEIPGVINVADFNNDGEDDIVLAFPQTDQVKVMFDFILGAPEFFSSDITLTQYNNEHPLWPAIGDINGDQLPDLVISSGTAYNFEVFTNTSTSSGVDFDPTSAVVNTDQLPGVIAVNDINKDGKNDVVVTYPASNQLALFKNITSSGTITFDDPNDMATGSEPVMLLATDMNNDEKTDMITVNRGADQFSIFRNALQSNPACYECVVDITISLKDNCKDYLTGIDDANGSSRQFGPTISSLEANPDFFPKNNCSSPTLFTKSWNTNIPGTGDVAVKPGEYSLFKEFKVNEKALDIYTQNYLKNNECILDYKFFEKEEVDKIDFSVCDMTCEECVAKLGLTYETSPHKDKITEEKYDELKEECEARCRITSPVCKGLYDNILKDVSPMGQYGEIIEYGTMNADGTLNEGNMALAPHLFPLSVFNDYNALPFKTGPQPVAGGPPIGDMNVYHQYLKFYADYKGYYESHYLVSGTPFPSANISADFFKPITQAFRASWRYPYNMGESDLFKRHAYLDANNEVVYITLTPLAGGGYEPAVDEGKYMFIMEQNGVQRIQPQYLSNLEDFLKHWKPEWARSLAVYHPEYGYYTRCTLMQESHDWDAKWLSVTTAADVPVSGGGTIQGANTLFTDWGHDMFLGVTVSTSTKDWLDLKRSQNYPSGVTGTYEIINATSGFISRGKSGIDPYFTDNRVYNTSGLYSQNILLDGEYDATMERMRTFFKDANGSSVSIWQAAYLIANCPDEATAGCNPTCLAGFGGTLSTDEEWVAFRSLYLSLKQEVQREHHTRVAIINDYYNGCIGNKEFESSKDFFLYYPYNTANSNNYPLNTVFPFKLYVANSQFHNPCQPCNVLRAELYKNKSKRYMGARDMPTQSFRSGTCNRASIDEFEVLACPEEVQQVLDNLKSIAETGTFTECGQCPVAMSFVTLFNSLITDEDVFASNVDMLKCAPTPYNYKPFVPILNKAINGGTLMSDATYTGTLSNGNKNLQITFTNTNTSATCNVFMQIPNTGSEALYTFNDIKSICCIRGEDNPSTQQKEFYILAYVEAKPGDQVTPLDYAIATPLYNQPGMSNLTKQIVLHGYSECLDLIACQTEVQCKPSKATMRFEQLINAIWFRESKHNPSPPAVVVPNGANPGFYDDANMHLYMVNPSTPKPWYLPFDRLRPLLNLDHCGDPKTYQWTGTLNVNGNTLSVRIDGPVLPGNAPNYCTVDLTLPSNAGFNFDQILTFADIQTIVGNTNGFTVQAKAITSAGIVTGVLTGTTTCFNTGDCYTDIPAVLENNPAKAPVEIYEIYNGDEGLYQTINAASPSPSPLLAGGYPPQPEPPGSFGYDGNFVPCELKDNVFKENGFTPNHSQFPTDIHPIDNELLGNIYYVINQAFVNRQNGDNDLPISGDLEIDIFAMFGCADCKYTIYLSKLQPKYTTRDIKSFKGVSRIISNVANKDFLVYFEMRDGSTFVVPGKVTLGGCDFAPYNIGDGPCMVSSPSPPPSTCYTDRFSHFDFHPERYEKTFVYNQQGTPTGYEPAPNYFTTYYDGFSTDLDSNSEARFPGMRTLGNEEYVLLWQKPPAYYGAHIMVMKYKHSATTGPQEIKVFAKTTTVLPNKPYRISFYHTKADDVKLTILINGLRPSVLTSNYGSSLTRYDIIWYANNATSATLEVYALKEVTIPNIDDEYLMLGFTFGEDNCPRICCPPITPEIEVGNSCRDLLLSAAKMNATKRYEEYIKNITEEFRRGYINKCLSAYENFTMTFENTEDHYTLYYYDQAGNLVRTVPPKGVKIIRDGAQLAQIKADREKGARTIFTTHELPTTYTYNSLNQLVQQSMPDQTDMDIWETQTKNNGIPSTHTVKGTWFTGDLAGISVTEYNSKGHIYVTSNGGSNWNKVTTFGTPDINHARCIPVGTNPDYYYYLVGKEGMVLRKQENDAEWTISKLPSATELVHVDYTFNSTGTEIWVYDKKGNIWYSTDNGANWNGPVVSLSKLVKGNIKDVWYANSTGNPIVAVSDDGKIYRSTNNGHTWRMEANTHKPLSLNAISFVNNYTGYAVGVDGTLLKGYLSKGEATIPAVWEEVHHNLRVPLTDVHFCDMETGMVTDVAGKLYRTTNGGLSFTDITPSGTGSAKYLMMQFYEAGKGYALRDDGLLLKTENSGANWTTISGPASVTASAFYRVMQANASNVQTEYLYIGTNNKQVYVSTDAGANWTAFATMQASSGNVIKDIITKDRLDVFVNIDGAVYGTPDAGANWTAITTVDNGNTITVSNALKFVNSNAAKYILTVDGKLFKANSGYTSWINLANTVSGTATDAWFYGNKGIITGTNGTLFVTEDEGATAWTNVGRVSNPPLYAVGGFTKKNLSSILVAGGAHGTILKFNPVELTWTNESTGCTTDILAFGAGFTASNDARCVATLKGNGSTTDILLYNETSMGEGWINKNILPNFSADVKGVVVNPSTDAIVVSTSDKGVFGSTNSSYTAWTTEMSAVAGEKDFYTLVADNNGVVKFAGGQSGIIYKRSSGGVWSHNNEFIPEILNDVFMVTNEVGYATGNAGSMYKTVDGGYSWNVQTTPVSSKDLYSVYFFTAMQGVAAGEDGTIITTVNGGQTWSTVTSGVSTDLHDISFEPGGYGLIAGNSGTILLSADRGLNWSTITVSGLTQHLRGVHVVDYAKAYISGDNGVFITLNNISTTLTTTQSSVQVKYLNQTVYATNTSHYKKVCFTDRTTGYLTGKAGSNTFIYKTTDGGAHWDEELLETAANTSATFQPYTLSNVGKQHFYLGGSGGHILRVKDQKHRFSSRFYYDQVGRLVVSQNSKQLDLSGNVYSYTLFDVKGRITEVGQISASTPIESQYISGVLDDALFTAWIAAGTRTQVTRTYYDNPAFDLPLEQKNLRSRVASTTFAAAIQVSDPTVYDAANHYTYDAHGNVDEMLVEIRKLKSIDNSPLANNLDLTYKTIKYEYDLVSGKVNAVHYQPDQPDQFHHQYEYDAENRLVKVETSYDQINWEEDARYFYYLHGPLARTELGHDEVQGLDYAYTIQGWLKGVNSNTLDLTRDIGGDGYREADAGNTHFATDAFGFTLGYNQTDYTAIASTGTSHFEASGTGNLTNKNLYNGNISHMVTAIGKFMEGGEQPLASTYQYDQLNRIKDANYYRDINMANNAWNTSPALLPDYANSFTYDANGNILTQKRSGVYGGTSNSLVTPPVAMDDLEYTYYDKTNKLRAVVDKEAQNSYGGDIEDQVNKTDNYRYDKLGNLIADDAEQITNIDWNVYGKIKSISFSEASKKPNLEFEYDATGNRIMKTVLPKTGSKLKQTTYYVRDAQGNIMATYDREYTHGVNYGSIGYTDINTKLIEEYVGDGPFQTFIYSLHLSTLSPSQKTLFINHLADQFKAMSPVTLKSYFGTEYIEELLLDNDMQGVYQNTITGYTHYQLINALSGSSNTYLGEVMESLCNCMSYLHGANGSNPRLVDWLMQSANTQEREYFFRALYILNQTTFDAVVQTHLGISYSDINDAINQLASKGDNDIINALDQEGLYTDCSKIKDVFIVMESHFNTQFHAIIAAINNSREMLTGLTGDGNCGLAKSTVISRLLDYDEALLLSELYDNNSTGDIVNWYATNYPELLLQIAFNNGLSSYIYNSQAGSGAYTMEEYMQYIHANFDAAVYASLYAYYQQTYPLYQEQTKLLQQHLYGSSRLGTYEASAPLYTARFTGTHTGQGNFTSVSVTSQQTHEPPTAELQTTRGKKRFELSNHLGNVLTVVSDKKTPTCGEKILVVNKYDYTLGKWQARNTNSEVLVDMQQQKTIINDDEDGARLPLILESSKSYTISFDYSLGGGAPDPTIEIFDATDENNLVSSSSQLITGGISQFTYNFTAPANEVYIDLWVPQRNGLSGEFYIDNVVLKENGSTAPQQYTADVVSATDYAPFGAELPGRTYSAGKTCFTCGQLSTLLNTFISGSGASGYNASNELAFAVYANKELNYALTTAQYRKALEECHLLQVLLDFNPGDQTAIKATGSMAPDMQVGTGAFTLEAWVYLTGSGKNTILSNMTDNGGGVLQGYQWYIENNEMHLLMGDNTNSNSTLHIQTSGSNLQANQWYHVAVTRQGNDANTGYYLYVNNTTQTLQVNSNQLTTGDIIGGHELHIGVYPHTINSAGYYTDYFEGYIHQVRVYKKFLTGGEITQNYQSGCFGKTQVLDRLIYDAPINDAGMGNISNYARINSEGQLLGNNTNWVFETGNSNCYNANTQVLCEYVNGMGAYRFGFQSQERDNEIYSEGRMYTAEYWEYDAALAKRWNADPITYPWQSSYAVFNNNPIIYIDPDGLYSKIGAMWRNTLYGGEGISKSESTGEWSYKTRPKGEAGVAEIDGLTSDERRAKIDKFKETHDWVGGLDGGWVERQTLSEYKPSLMDKWSESTGFVGKFSYDFANSIYTAPQIFTQPFTGGWYSLNGTEQVRGSSELTGNFLTGAASFVPMGSIGTATKGAAFGERLFLSEKFGITSLRFGSSAANAQGALNQAGRLFKVGWSTGKNSVGQWGYKFRIGIGSSSANPNLARFHVYVPRSFVPNSFANPSIQVKRSLFNLELKP